MACMALLLVITLLNVVTRYLTDQSFAWTEEISVFLMVVMTLAGASAAIARDRHIRIEFFYDGGTPQRQRRLKVFGACLVALLFAGVWRCCSGASSPTRSATTRPRWAWACRAGGSRRSRPCCASRSRFARIGVRLVARRAPWTLQR